MKAWAVIVLAVTACTADDFQWDYGVGIDAGSGGSRIYLYKWPSAQTGRRAFIQPQTNASWALSIGPGLGTFASRIGDLEGYLNILLHFAEGTIQNEGVDARRLSTFPLFLKATAGMRVLKDLDREAIMAEVRRVFASSPFYFVSNNARVISGEEEGVLDWIAVNYQRKTLFDPAAQIGIIDVGGASVEVTTVPPTDIIGDYFALRLRDHTIGVYTHSYLQFGLNLAHSRALYELVRTSEPDDKGAFTSPCHPRGSAFSVKRKAIDPLFPVSHHTEFKGDGAWDGCVAVAAALLKKHESCWTWHCGPAGEYQPSLGVRPVQLLGHAQTTVLDELLLTEDASLDEIKHAGSAVCGMSNSDLKRAYPDIDPEHSARFCWNAVWLHTLLHEGFGFKSAYHQLLYRRNDIGEIGAMLYEINQLPWKPAVPPPPPPTHDNTWLFLVGLAGVVVLSVAAIAIACCAFRRKYTSLIQAWNLERDSYVL